mmetsp:Transcript_17436/g.53624  ORF Transcript_17436/g.53624 Transcript_17436/m.53624 type:complete len:277 (+) Transcript_17436:1485-2315(+)
MRAERRDADRGARHLGLLARIGGRLERLEAEDLAALPRHLHLLLGVAVRLELVDVRDDVERERVRELFVRRLLVAEAAVRLEVRRALRDGRRDAGLELGHARRARARRRLIRRDDDLLEAKREEQREERHERDGRRAVGVRDDLRAFAELAVDLGHDQRHVRVVAQRGRVVDDDAALREHLADLLRVLRREVARRGEEDDVEAARGLDAERLGRQVAPLRRGDGLAALGPEERRARVAAGEAALLEHADDFLADRARGADDRDFQRRVALERHLQV